MLYAVINQDNSIHTISEKDDDVLLVGQKRFTVDEIPLADNIDFLVWDDNQKLVVRRPEAERTLIADQQNEWEKKTKIKKIVQELEIIKSAKLYDETMDFSLEKNQLQEELQNLQS